MSDRGTARNGAGFGSLGASRYLLILMILISTVTVDQVTKVVARRALPGRGTIEVVGTVLVMVYVENQGAFLGLGSEWHPSLRAVVFGLLSGIIVLGAVVFLVAHRRMGRVETIALSLIAGGGIGNMIDRVTRGGAVSDFLNLGIGKLRTGVFNLADLFLMAGLAIFLVATFTHPKPTGEVNEEERD